MEIRTVNYQINNTGSSVYPRGRRTELTYNWVIKLGLNDDVYYGSIYCKEFNRKQEFTELKSKNEKLALQELQKYCAVQSGYIDVHANK